MTALSPTSLIAGNRQTNLAVQCTNVGTGVLRYGLVLVLAWIGMLKFQSYEAMAIMPLIANSPFMSWLLGSFGLELTARAIGTVEIFAAVCIALRPVSPRLSVVGSIVAVCAFCATLSFLFTTPAMAIIAAGHVFPFLGMIGQFLLKDVVLLGAAIYIAGESWAAAASTAALRSGA